MTENIQKNNFNEFLLYTTPNGDVKIEIFLQNETVWLTQQKMAQVFNVQKPAISKHLKNIFESGELNKDSVVSEMETTADDGKLDAFLEFNEEAILKNAGHISHNIAKKLAETEFRKYKIEHDKTIESDFDRMIQDIK